MSKRLGSHFRSGRVDYWLKIKDPAAPAVMLEAEKDWGKDNSNPLFLIVISSILGGVLGYLMGQLAGVLKARRADTTARTST